MKPTVISSGGNINSNNDNNPQNNKTNQGYSNTGQQPEQGQYYYGNPSNQQQQPQHYQQQQPPQQSQQRNPQHFQSFGFDPDIEEMFPEGALRSRLGRMRDPFFNRTNVDDFFPSGFGSLGRRSRPHAQGDIFDNFPDDFRQYIPDDFGFSSRNRVPQSSRTQPHQPQQAHPQYQTQQPQYQQPQYQQPQYQQQHYQVPESPKPNLCDAAIQTENDFPDEGLAQSNSGPKVNQQGLRNAGSDIGSQNVQNEENRSPRSHSAPPNEQNDPNMNPGQKKVDSAGKPIYISKATFSPSVPHNSPGHPPTPPTRQHFPPQNRPQPFHLHQQSQSEPQPPPPQSQGHQTISGGGFIRTVPIFVEGRKEPVINAHKHIPTQQNTTSTQSYNQAEQPNYDQQQQYHQPPQDFQHPNQQQRQQNRPVPLNAQNEKEHPLPPGVVPQTPHTTECIEKILNIQRDVLALMGEVENFKGLKNDKDYMFLDEMLTRNLLKLDNIDTHGKEKIRLARKEAIRCIQASINGLEEKAESNARGLSQNFEEELNEPTLNVEAVQNKEIIEENPLTLSKSTIIPLPAPEPHNDGKIEEMSPSAQETNRTIESEDQQISTEIYAEKNNENAEVNVNTPQPESSPNEQVDENKVESEQVVEGGDQTEIPLTENIINEESNNEFKKELTSIKEERSSNSPSKEIRSSVSPNKEDITSNSPSKEAKEGARKKIVKRIKKVCKKDDDKKSEEPNEA